MFLPPPPPPLGLATCGAKGSAVRRRLRARLGAGGAVTPRARVPGVSTGKHRAQRPALVSALRSFRATLALLAGPERGCQKSSFDKGACLPAALPLLLSCARLSTTAACCCCARCAAAGRRTVRRGPRAPHPAPPSFPTSLQPRSHTKGVFPPRCWRPAAQERAARSHALTLGLAREDAHPPRAAWRVSKHEKHHTPR